jgi:DNA primase
MVVDPSTTKYLIRATVNADGVVEKPDIIGAVFGQTEGLLGNELDLRDLQKSARIGRVEVDIETRNGKTNGTILLPSALDKVESAILAAGLETIDRIGPAKALIKVTSIEDTREARRKSVVDRAKELLSTINESSGQDSSKIADEVRSAVQVAEVTKFRNTKLPAGPNVDSSDSVILVEGRNDVINLLKCGIKNAVAVEGTNIPDEIKDLTKEKTTIIFVDGDRGGELIAKEILQTCEVDFVARAPPTREVEELPHKLVMKCLKNKVTAEQFTSQMGIVLRKPEGAGSQKPEAREGREERGERPQREERQGGERRDDRREGGREGRGERPAREERGERPEGGREERQGGRDGERRERRGGGGAGAAAAAATARRARRPASRRPRPPPCRCARATPAPSSSRSWAPCRAA